MEEMVVFVKYLSMLDLQLAANVKGQVNTNKELKIYLVALLVSAN